MPSPPILDFNTFHFVLAGETGELDTRRTQRESKAPPLLAAAAAAVTPIFGGAFSTDAGALDFRCGSSISITQGKRTKFVTCSAVKKNRVCYVDTKFLHTVVFLQ